jgi:toxin HigB-1
MIHTFHSKETERIWKGEFSTKLPPDIQNIARRKLRMLNNSNTLKDLQIPPSNMLEELKGNRKGQYSIRINRQ